MTVQIFDDYEKLSRHAAQLVYSEAIRAVETTGRYDFVLSGGGTPSRLYKLLAKAPYRDDLPWEYTHLYWGDERCVPPDHDESNHRLVQQLLLEFVPVRPENIHR